MAIRHRKKQSNTRLWLLIALLVAVCAVIFLLPAGEPTTAAPAAQTEVEDEVAAFREQQGYTFAMGLDPERKIYDRFASNYIPRNFLIDKEGRVAMVTVGYEPEEFDLMVEAVQLYLPEK